VEARDHLRDAAEEERRAGAAPGEAEQRAVERFGEYPVPITVSGLLPYLALLIPVVLVVASLPRAGDHRETRAPPASQNPGSARLPTLAPSTLIIRSRIMRIEYARQRRFALQVLYRDSPGASQGVQAIVEMAAEWQAALMAEAAVLDPRQRLRPLHYVATWPASRTEHMRGVASMRVAARPTLAWPDLGISLARLRQGADRIDTTVRRLIPVRFAPLGPAVLMVIQLRSDDSDGFVKANPQPTTQFASMFGALNRPRGEGLMVVVLDARGNPLMAGAFASRDEAGWAWYAQRYRARVIPGLGIHSASDGTT
jgi:hypothetical protein